MKIKNDPKAGKCEITFPDGIGVKYDSVNGKYELYGPEGPIVNVEMHDGGRYDVDVACGAGRPGASSRRETRAPAEEPAREKDPTPAVDDKKLQKLRNYLKKSRSMSEIMGHMGLDSKYKTKHMLDAVGAEMEGQKRGTTYKIK